MLRRLALETGHALRSSLLEGTSSTTLLSEAGSTLSSSSSSFASAAASRIANSLLASSSGRSSFSTFVSAPAQQAAAGLADFIEPPLKEGEKRVAGRAWTASDLRKKSWDDLHSLWIVLLKEKNLLLSERDAARARKERLANPFRVTKVRKSMGRVKAVMWERAQLESKDVQELRSLKAFIDALQLLVWAAPEGRDETLLGALALGAPGPSAASAAATAPSTSSSPRREATATTLLRGSSSAGKEDEGSVSLARRLAARLGRPVAVAWNLPSLSAGGASASSSSSSSAGGGTSADAAALHAWAERRLLAELDRAGMLPATAAATAAAAK